MSSIRVPNLVPSSDLRNEGGARLTRSWASFAPDPTNCHNEAHTMTSLAIAVVSSEAKV